MAASPSLQRHSVHMTPQSLTKALKEEALRLGFDLAGAARAGPTPAIEHFRRWISDGYAGRMSYLVDRAEAYEHPRAVLASVRSILMLAVNYRTVEPADLQAGQGRISRYAWGVDYHELIRPRLRRLAEFHLRQAPQAAVRGVVDTAPLAERGFAQLAGLGWIGKNTLLVNRELGSWCFLAALLTSEKLHYDEPSAGNRCGSCRACLDACPTGALRDDYRLDARKCISYLTIELDASVPVELRAAIGERIFGCDACQEVCPWNRRAAATEEVALRSSPGAKAVDLAELLGLDEVEFRRRFRHTPLWRPKRRGILRNAAIVLGNRPHPAAMPALVRALHDVEPLVRAAAAWALGRYPGEAAQSALTESLAVEPNLEVKGEIQAARRHPP